MLELRPPEHPTLGALLLLWPTPLSYAVSYPFIAIVWTNHHYLLRYAEEATPRLLWFNFPHPFSMSLLPLSTAWMAVSRLSPQPVAFCVTVFFLVNATYICLIWELVIAFPRTESPRRCAEPCGSGRSQPYAFSELLRLSHVSTRLAGLIICICCLIVYLKPDPPSARTQQT